MTYTPGLAGITLNARAPQLAGGSFILSPPEKPKAGTTVMLLVSGAKPASLVDLYMGTAGGRSPVRTCAIALGVKDAKLAATSAADAKGNARLKLPLPKDLADKTLFLQAVDRSACRVSEVVTVKVE
jgi:hypothetical protein